MSALRRISRTVLVALVATGLGSALAAAPSSAKPTAKVDGVRVSPCRGMQAVTFSVFVRGIDCDRALERLSQAASHDRACPRGWRAKKRVRITLGQARSPHVTLCSRQRQAFTYHLPVG